MAGIRPLPNVANGNMDRIPVSGCGILSSTSKWIVYVPRDTPGGIELFRSPFKMDQSMRTFTFRLPPGELFTDVGSEYELIQGGGEAHDVSWQQVPEGSSVFGADRIYTFLGTSVGCNVQGSLMPYPVLSARFAVTGYECGWDSNTTLANEVRLTDGVTEYFRHYIPSGSVPSAMISRRFDTPLLLPAGLVPNLISAGGGGFGVACAYRATVFGCVVPA